VLRYHFPTQTLETVLKPDLPFDASHYETTQVFYTSKDGTRVPMFLTHKKGLALDGSNPTLLYGYGGFNISLTPNFAPQRIAWLEAGGVYAVANLRGGGEYGESWHQAGTVLHKQNVFDDFHAAAEWLIQNGYTRPDKLAIQGGSNGGLLVGACLLQRPELYGAVVCQVPVADMVRYHRFTVGRFWVSDYGNADESADHLRYQLTYSPVHNCKPGVKYPATLITTADHDDRVAPAHAFKFAAALQAAQAGEAPILLRVDVKAGHGAGKPTTKLIEEQADVYAFLFKALGVPYRAAG
jgi:prolyl oligopeptidase